VSTLTEFGATTKVFMASWGMDQIKDLCELIRESGEQLSDASMRNWIYGKHTCPSRIVRAIADVLQLNEEEMTRLAHAYTYGQDRFVQPLEVLPTYTT
jgi:hypothetical protein